MSEAIDYIQQTSEFAHSMESESPSPWLGEFRKQQLEWFRQSTFPTRKTEHFRYNNLSGLTRTLLNRQVNSTSPYDLSALPLNIPEAIVILFVDGKLQTQSAEASGITVTAFSKTNPEQQQKLLAHYQSTQDRKNLFRALSNGMAHEGLFLEIASNIPVRPIHMVHVTTDVSQSSSLNYHLVVALESNAQATVIEHYFTPNSLSNDVMVNQTSTFIVGNGAQLNHYGLNLEDESVYHFGHLDFQLHRDAQLNSFHVGLGSRLNRVDINVRHLKGGSHADLNGVYFARNKQQVDYHTNVEHQVPNCTTQEVFRGLINDSAKAVFNGRIHIFPKAQKTLAELSNKNLLLSNKAEINTKPELEIYADDVRCAHGATVAQMDKKALFYLVSRGIPKAQAQLMLSFGFINELLDQLKHEEVASYLRPLLSHLFYADSNSPESLHE